MPIHSQDAVEAFFKHPFKPVDRRAELKTSPKPPPSLAAISFTGEDTLLLLRGGAEIRDKEWIDHLRKHNIDVPLPPIESGDFRTTLLGRLFTKQQVLTLISRAVELRDRAWSIWRDNPWRHDGGPQPLEIEMLDSKASFEIDPKQFPNPIKWR